MPPTSQAQLFTALAKEAGYNVVKVKTAAYTGPGVFLKPADASSLAVRRLFPGMRVAMEFCATRVVAHPVKKLRKA